MSGIKQLLHHRFSGILVQLSEYSNVLKLLFWPKHFYRIYSRKDLLIFKNLELQLSDSVLKCFCFRPWLTDIFTQVFTVTSLIFKTWLKLSDSNFMAIVCFHYWLYYHECSSNCPFLPKCYRWRLLRTKVYQTFTINFAFQNCSFNCLIILKCHYCCSQIKMF